MDNSYKIIQLLTSLLEQLPSIITIIGCIIFAIVRWKRAPRVALLVLIALLLILVHGPLFAAVYQWVPELLGYSPGSGVPFYANKIMLTIGLIYHLALAIPFALLFAAIFMQRPARGSS
jgi:hypothetical protein